MNIFIIYFVFSKVQIMFCSSEGIGVFSPTHFNFISFWISFINCFSFLRKIYYGKVFVNNFREKEFEPGSYPFLWARPSPIFIS